MKKKIIFALLICIFYKCSVSALTYGGCEFSDVARMKQIATNVTVAYDYRIVNDVAYFDVTVSNLTSDLYASDDAKRNYYANSNGELVIKNIKSDSITLKFNSNKSQCKGLFLGSRYVNFPIFNKYYDDKVCEGMTELVQCNKWVQKTYTYDEVNSAVNEYLEYLNNKKEEATTVTYKKTLFDKIVDFYVKYYLIVLSGVVLICLTIIIVNRRKNEFKI